MWKDFCPNSALLDEEHYENSISQSGSGSPADSIQAVGGHRDEMRVHWAFECGAAPRRSTLGTNKSNQPLPKPPLGISSSLSELKEPPSPERVRLGRWLFYDKRLSADGSVSCASCHQSEHAFSESTPNSTGIRGQKGGRKAPSFVNQAWTLYPHFFWDGRAGSLEEQALGPIANPIEMGNTHEAMIKA